MSNGSNKKVEASAFQEGYGALRYGFDVRDNPYDYKAQSGYWYQWHFGWLAAYHKQKEAQQSEDGGWK